MTSERSKPTGVQLISTVIRLKKKNSTVISKRLPEASNVDEVTCHMGHNLPKTPPKAFLLYRRQSQQVAGEAKKIRKRKRNIVNREKENKAVKVILTHTTRLNLNYLVLITSEKFFTVTWEVTVRATFSRLKSTKGRVDKRRRTGFIYQ